MKVEPARSRAVPSGRMARGRLRLPPSKSYSHRYLNLALLAGGRLTVDQLLDAEDIGLFRGALEALGFGLEEHRDGVTVVPPLRWPQREVGISCGNAGTLFRFLTATLTVVPGRFRLDGTPRLRERPVGALVAALRDLGAKIHCPRREGFAPLVIEGESLEGGRTTLDASESSQYVSALLMAATRARREVTIRPVGLVSAPYLEVTLDALATFGVDVDRSSRGELSVVPRGLRPPARVVVEGDYSAAAYPATAALVTGGTVLLEGLRDDSPQGDRRFFEVLQSAGGQVRWMKRGLEVAPGPLQAVQVDLRDMPDQVPTLSALAPFLSGVTRIEGAAHLRIKESDRLAATASELTKLGVPVRERADGLVIEGCWAENEPPATPVEVDPHDDHRIAMSMALVGLRRPGVVIREPEVVAKSYPHFWRDLETLLG